MATQSVTAGPDADLLREAFRTFDGAAATLQQSYRALTCRLERMDLELAERNDSLKRNLRANEELREHLTAILEALATGILVTDNAGIVTRCNKAGEALLGLPRERILGRPLEDCVEEARLQGTQYPLITNSGAVVTLSRQPLPGSGGQPAGGLTLIQDVTTVHQLEERLQRRDRLAAMGEMVGRIAHEIRNPLGSIELFASMLRRDVPQQDGLRGYADHICSAVQLLDRLLSNLLLYTKPDCSRAEWHRTETLLEDALTLAAHAIAKSRLDIRLQVDPSAERVWCDAGQLKQALLNLVLNALQAMPDGGTLTLTAGTSPVSEAGAFDLRLTISDTGVGIAPGHRSRIFDPFFTTRDEGTGLGLAIVHAIVEAHRGRIDVDSLPGVGTTFTIVLPAAPPPPMPQAIRDQPAEPSEQAAAGAQPEETTT